MSKPVTVTVSVTIEVDPEVYKREYNEDATRKQLAAWVEGTIEDAVVGHPLRYLYRVMEVKAR